MFSANFDRNIVDSRQRGLKKKRTKKQKREPTVWRAPRRYFALGTREEFAQELVLASVRIVRLVSR
jgi:hypothetical protein